jgi:hypothetical protein
MMPKRLQLAGLPYRYAPDYSPQRRVCWSWSASLTSLGLTAPVAGRLDLQTLCDLLSGGTYYKFHYDFRAPNSAEKRIFNEIVQQRSNRDSRVGAVRLWLFWSPL